MVFYVKILALFRAHTGEMLQPCEQLASHLRRIKERPNVAAQQAVAPPQFTGCPAEFDNVASLREELGV